jgi:hypothetical protein
MKAVTSFMLSYFSFVELNCSVYCLWKSVERLKSFCRGIFKCKISVEAHLARFFRPEILIFAVLQAL